MNEYKRCPKCGKTQHWTEFGMSKQGWLNGYCRSCRRIQSQEYRHSHSSEKRASGLRWYYTHLDQAREYSRQYRKAHPEAGREAAKRWCKMHPAEAGAARAKWSRSEKGKASRIVRHDRRRARKAGNGGSFTAAEWTALKAHYGNRCLCCGRDDVKLTADHVLPVAMGGTSNISNIQPLCQSCNSRKRSKHIDYR